MTSRNQREGWYGGKLARGTTVNGKPVRHLRADKDFSLRASNPVEVTAKQDSGVIHNAEILENFPIEVKGLDILQGVMAELAERKKGST